MHPYSVKGAVLHSWNNPKKLQTSQAVHKLWRPPPSCRSQRWIFVTASSKFMSFRQCKAQTNPQVRVHQLLLTRTTLTNPIVLVRRSPQSHWLHDHQLIDKFIDTHHRTFMHAVEQHLMTQQQRDDGALTTAPS